MTTPGGGRPERPAGFSSPMGTGNMAKRASAAAAADLANLASAAAKYRKDMEAAAKAAEKATAEVKKQHEVIKQLSRLDTEAIYAKQGWTGMSTGGGRSGNGGGARIPVALPAGGGGRGGGGGTTLVSGGASPVPNGGGARFGGLHQVHQGTWSHPGGGGQPPTQPPILEGSVAPNGGGARFSGFAGRAGGVIGKGLAAVGGAAFAELMDMDNARSRDFLANRASRISGSAYDKSAGAALVTRLGNNSFRSPEEQMAFFRPLITDNRTGFTAGSAEMARIAGGAQVTAALNPLAGATAGQTSVNFGKPQMFNTLRMMTGIQTIGRGGAPKTPDELARELVASTTQGRFGTGVGSRSMTSKQVEAALGETGGLRLQMNAAGMDEGMQSAIAEYLRSSSGGRYADPNAIRGRRTRDTDTIYGQDQRAATAKQNLVASYIEDFAEGVKTGTDGVVKAMDYAATAIRSAGDNARDAVFGTTGAAAAVGEHGGKPGKAALGGIAAAGAGAAALAWRNKGKIARGARFIPGVGWALGGAAALWAGAKGARGADYSGGFGSDIAAGLGGAGGGLINELTFGAFGDGPGERPKPKFGTAAFPGVAGAEMGDSDGGPGGRGKGTINYLKELMARSGLPHRITSTKRSGGGRSYHDTGHAIDIAGPTPGVNTKEMLAINRYLATKLGRGAKELIYSGPGGTNLYNGNPHVYSASVRKNHHDHVHVAVTEASLKNKGEALTGSEEEAMIRGEKAVARQQRSQRRSTGIGQGRSLALGRQGRSGTGFSERKLIEDILAGGGGSRFVGRPAVADDPLEGIATSGPGSGKTGPSVGAHAVDKFLYGLRMHESRGDYEAENGGTRGAVGGDSSASGAYQYLDRTWGNYRGYKYAAAAPPHIQDERARMDASRLYSRHGNWRMVAAAHFQGEGWLNRNPDPSKWDAAGNRSGGNPLVSKYVSSVLDRAGLPETGDGPGSITADVPRPQQYRQSGGGGSTQVDARRGGTIHISKVEVKLTTPQVSEAEAERIGKMVVDKIARAARMSEMSA